jgi:hypothetical protein
MRNLFLIIFIGVEIFGWWFSATDISVCIRKRDSLCWVSKYWIVFHILLIVLLGFLYWG